MGQIDKIIRQHTPIIHFQPEYADCGATLRATEVKPKLDKYVIQKLKSSGKAYKQWLVGLGEKEALDYKMRIDAPSGEVWDLEKTVVGKDGRKKTVSLFPVFFGNMGSDRNAKPKKLVFTDKEIHLTVYSLHEDLLPVIQDCLGPFFLTHNFGTRQSKGFGSFMLQDQIPPVDEYLTLSLKAGNEDAVGFQHLFESIDLFYKTLRSGINNKPLYFKSLMYHYVLDSTENDYYDKRAIRYFFGHFMPNIDDDKGECYESGMARNRTPLLYRDMLGLSSSQDWFAYNASIKKKHGDITRFKSPLLIKPVRNGGRFTILLIPTSIPREYFSQEFSIVSKAKRKDKDWLGEQGKEGRSMRLCTPSSFDLQNFLEYALIGKGRTEAEKQIRQNEREISQLDEDSRVRKALQSIKRLKEIYKVQ